jgi:hypothetical protein
VMESKTLTLRLEMSNAFNLVNLANPGTGVSSTANIGRISTANPMRLIQMGLRFKF